MVDINKEKKEEEIKLIIDFQKDLVISKLLNSFEGTEEMRKCLRGEKEALIFAEKTIDEYRDMLAKKALILMDESIKDWKKANKLRR
jgi:hypothetical protein